MKLDEYFKQLFNDTAESPTAWCRRHRLDASVVGRLAAGGKGSGPTWAKIMSATDGAVTPLDHWPQKRRKGTK